MALGVLFRLQSTVCARKSEDQVLVAMCITLILSASVCVRNSTLHMTGGYCYTMKETIRKYFVDDCANGV